MLSRPARFLRYSRQYSCRSSGRAASQSSSMRHSFCTKIFAWTTTGPINPYGSKIMAMSEATTRFVITATSFHFGDLKRKQSVLGSQTSPSVLTVASDVSSSSRVRSSRRCSGTSSRMSREFECHFRNENPPDSIRSTISATSSFPSATVCAPANMSST
uniref:(northern house mosquito) hypothetical protein n=2 Tax=Culex pipiens TaxID=7175 RepID=A0A8D8JLQ0_CULPI